MKNDCTIEPLGPFAASPELLHQAYRKLLKAFNPEQIKRDEPLNSHLYTRVGGKADIAVFPLNYRQVQDAVLCANQFGIRYWVIGNGSNLLVRDGGVRGMVIVLTGLTKIRREKNTIIAQGGVPVIQLAQFARQNHLSGLEFACGIPGTVGGAIRMNAGAYGGQVSDVLKRVVVLTAQGNQKTLTKEYLRLTYRDSDIEAKGWIVLEAVFRLLFDDGGAIQAKMDDFTQRRVSTQPLEYPSCGSVFKRPPNDYAGRLIRDSGLQGVRIGGAEVSTKHAGFIVNVDHASASHYIELIRHIQAAVKKKHGVELETEVKIIGEDV